jgi:transglutaminase/protease-like cytokinesis protein 3
MRFIFLVLVIFCYSIKNSQSTPLLAAIEIELESKQTLPLAKKISFELLSSNASAIAKSLSDWQNISTNQIDDRTLSVSMLGMPIYSGEVARQHVTNSFVVDIDEESTKHFVSGFINNVKHPRSFEQLVSYVNHHIQQPTYIHGFSIASVVALEGSGDCTEYAVLAAALARSLDIPARVVIGTVILEENSQITAFGHAWIEVSQNDKWQILDAALINSEASQLFYLPASALENEGPGYGLSLAKATNLMPMKIKHVRNY